MKTSARLFVSVTGMVLAVHGGLFAEAAPAKLRLSYKPKAGAQAFYKCEYKYSTLMPEAITRSVDNLQVMTDHMEYSETVLSVDAKGDFMRAIHYGLHTSEETNTNKKWEKMMKKYAPPKDSLSLQDRTLGMKLTAAGKILDSESFYEILPEETSGKGKIHGQSKLILNDEIRNGLQEYFVEFPEKDLQVGDTWRGAPINFMGTTKLIEYRLAGFEKVMDYDCAVIDQISKASVSSQKNLETFFSDKDSKLVKDIIGVGKDKDLGQGAGSGSGKVYFAYKQGVVVKYAYDYEQTADSPSAGGDMAQVKTTIHNEIALVDLKQAK